jgi:hypothetical protein
MNLMVECEVYGVVLEVFHGYGEEVSSGSGSGESSPHYCVKFLTAVFNYFELFVVAPTFFLTKLPWLSDPIAGWVCQRLFTLTDPTGYGKIHDGSFSKMVT